jgi:hypothetical protein
MYTISDYISLTFNIQLKTKSAGRPQGSARAKQLKRATPNMVLPS